MGKRLAPLTKASKPGVNGPWWMVKNSNGKKDAALTLMLLAFVFTLAMTFLSAIHTVNIGDKNISFREFDMGFPTVVLIPLIGLYFGRRWTDVQAGVYEQQKLYAPKVGEKSEQMPKYEEEPYVDEGA